EAAGAQAQAQRDQRDAAYLSLTANVVNAAIGEAAVGGGGGGGGGAGGPAAPRRPPPHPPHRCKEGSGIVTDLLRPGICCRAATMRSPPRSTARAVSLTHAATHTACSPYRHLVGSASTVECGQC
ncbi:hypothetical protein ACX84W_17070, partial [Xanthomonas euvesicatoria]